MKQQSTSLDLEREVSCLSDLQNLTFLVLSKCIYIINVYVYNYSLLCRFSQLFQERIKIPRPKLPSLFVRFSVKTLFGTAC